MLPGMMRRLIFREFLAVVRTPGMYERPYPVRGAF